jgi:hypothetical protein
VEPPGAVARRGLGRAGYEPLHKAIDSTCSGPHECHGWMGAAYAAPIHQASHVGSYVHSSGADAGLMWVSDPGGRMKKK